MRQVAILSKRRQIALTKDFSTFVGGMSLKIWIIVRVWVVAIPYAIGPYEHSTHFWSVCDNVSLYSIPPFELWAPVFFGYEDIDRVGFRRVDGL
jgi:hypothetical protein